MEEIRNIVWHGGILCKDEKGNEYCSRCGKQMDKMYFVSPEAEFLCEKHVNRFLCEDCADEFKVNSAYISRDGASMPPVKWIKHRKLLSNSAWGDTKGAFDYMRFECRGCLGEEREKSWQNYKDLILEDYYCWKNDYGYLELWEEPYNPHDPNALLLVCNGAVFGSLGYAGKEFAERLHTILCECNAYRVEVANKEYIGKKAVPMEFYWI